MNNLISALKILDLSADGILGFLGEIIGAVATINMRRKKKLGKGLF